MVQPVPPLKDWKYSRVRNYAVEVSLILCILKQKHTQLLAENRNCLHELSLKLILLYLPSQMSPLQFALHTV